MTVSPDEAVTVSYLGYDDYTFTPGNTATFNIVLERSAATMLDETVVIGYGKTTKKEVTGSVTSLKSADFDLGSFTDATAMLQGKVAGLTITNPDGGDPNGSYEILLRGTNTLMAGQGPLIIIDGVVDADIRNINFQEVESIDVLKDGSAAAIYGTRGTNGVIIITTKRAKAGQMTVEYDGQVQGNHQNPDQSQTQSRRFRRFREFLSQDYPQHRAEPGSAEEKRLRQISRQDQYPSERHKRMADDGLQSQLREETVLFSEL